MAFSPIFNPASCRAKDLPGPINREFVLAFFAYFRGLFSGHSSSLYSVHWAYVSLCVYNEFIRLKRALSSYFSNKFKRYFLSRPKCFLISRRNTALIVLSSAIASSRSLSWDSGSISKFMRILPRSLILFWVDFLGIGICPPVFTIYKGVYDVKNYNKNDKLFIFI